MLQNVGKQVCFVSVYNASQVESLVNVPVVEELVLRVHVEGRPHLVNVISQSFTHGDGPPNGNEHLEIIAFFKLI